MKEAAYKGMVRPILEYGSSVWDPQTDMLQEELEKIQNRAARFVTRNYVYETGSMAGILGQLRWESLKKRRKDNRLILLYRGIFFWYENKLVENQNYSLQKCRNGGFLRENARWYFEGKKIEVVSAYKYMGLMVTPKLIWTTAKTKHAN